MPVDGGTPFLAERLPWARGVARGEGGVAQPWQRRYRPIVQTGDAIALTLSVVAAELIRFGTSGDAVSFASIPYTMLGALIVLGWWVTLQLYGSADRSILGHGPEEYQRVAHASVVFFGIVAIASLLLQQDVSRGYLAIAFPAGVSGLLIGRKISRMWLVAHRRKGKLLSNVLIIGGRRAATSIERHLSLHSESGMRVTGVWTPDQPHSAAEWLDVPNRFVPVLGAARRLEDALSLADAGAVIVTDTEHLGHRGLKDLIWDLQERGVDLMVSPNVMDVSRPRIELRAVGGMPFIHMDQPQFAGATRWAKTAFDRVFAFGCIAVLSPLLVVAAVAVRMSSPGPVLYRSERIGIGGEAFQMLKFRSMVIGADEQKSALDSDLDGVLFKVKDDPRVTRVGSFMRRYSIDELPQLFNVLRGDMSIVGPRPPLRSEVDRYDDVVERRLLVKQGLTGLWQVSGRSDLSWEESVRLDLDYVENWSLLRDVQIIWRTVRAVTRGRGAY